ncbi:hypothetical protein E2C01_064114 [Portunus trituberculatus]|uniref:Uncharacterized protein n=1 Tax=Portunus trituberculatus TaxID=210409 RepID=A0A5B7HFF0_PORTR|nr:hypothetical protein [Portunus trituberculatus]
MRRIDNFLPRIPWLFCLVPLPPSPHCSSGRALSVSFPPSFSRALSTFYIARRLASKRDYIGSKAYIIQGEAAALSCAPPGSESRPAPPCCDILHNCVDIVLVMDVTLPRGSSLCCVTDPCGPVTPRAQRGSALRHGA